MTIPCSCGRSAIEGSKRDMRSLYCKVCNTRFFPLPVECLHIKTTMHNVEDYGETYVMWEICDVCNEVLELIEVEK